MKSHLIFKENIGIFPEILSNHNVKSMGGGKREGTSSPFPLFYQYMKMLHRTSCLTQMEYIDPSYHKPHQSSMARQVHFIKKRTCCIIATITQDSAIQIPVTEFFSSIFHIYCIFIIYNSVIIMITKINKSVFFFTQHFHE